MMETGTLRRRLAAALRALALLLACVTPDCIARAPAVASADEAMRPQPRLVRMGVEAGLSTTLYDLVVDRKGYVWVATGDGLARYDGTGFRFWRREIGRTPTLPGNEITVLHVDVRDRLWIATWDGLDWMGPDRERLHPVAFTDAAAGCGVDIAAITSSRDGTVWLVTNTGQMCRIAPEGTVSRVSADDGDPVHGNVFAMTARPSGVLLIGTDDGLWRLDPGKSELRAERLHWPGDHDQGVYVFSPAPDDGLWVGGDRTLLLLDRDDLPKPLPWSPPPGLRRAMVARGGDGYDWIGSYAGLHRRRLGQVPTAQDAMPSVDDGVIRMAADHEGGIWVAGYSQGLFHIAPDPPRFRTASLPADDLAAYVKSATIDAAGMIWALSNGGLYRQSGGLEQLQRVADARNLELDKAEAVRVCADGRVAIAEMRGALEFDPATRRVHRRFRVTDENDPHTLETIACGPDGSIWLSLFGGGLVRLPANGGPPRIFTPEETLDVETEAYIDLRFAPDGAPWYSDGRALRRWDGTRFRKLAVAPGEYVYALDFAADGTLWVARFGSLERYRWDGRRLERMAWLSADEGLPNAEVRSVRATAGGQLWMNGVRGLVQYDTRARRARVFGPADGLPGIDFTGDQFAWDATGRGVAIVGRDVVRFDPERPLSVPRPSPLAIESLSLRRGEDTVALPIDGDAPVVVHPGDRDLRVVARVMSYVNPAAHRYRFRLRGYDPDWVTQGVDGERGERAFSTLAPGRYALDVQGANADGVWSATRRIAILVEAPWWRRWWAVALYALAASALLAWLAMIDRARQRRRHSYQLIKQKRELAEQASLAKSRFLANLGHEVRTPMTGVLGMSELLLSTPLDAKQHGQVQAIRRAGDHLLRLVNDALDLARIEAGRFELHEADFALDGIVDDLAGLMRPLAERKGLRFEVFVDPAARGGWRGDATRLRQILLNLLGNAIKFTERGEVALTLEPLSPHGLRCSVRDTGPGLDAEQQRRLFRRFEQAEGARTASRYGGSGLGLAICQELAVAMGGGVELVSSPGEGACFIVRLPLARADVPAGTPSDVDLPGDATDTVASTCDVLLVEDDPTVADVLTGLLQARGHRVVHAAHALAALTAQATRHFDVALIDLDLPGMDGLALARQLRAGGFDRPMIAVTARADTDAEPQAMAAGFDGFLRKPVTGEMLAEVIARHGETVP